jgi:UDP-GlcNAc3NAcA epimerase
MNITTIGKIVSVIGARSQFVKASAVSRALRMYPGVREVLLHTGQHYDENMSSIIFAEMDIPAPDYNIGVGSGLHGAQTGRMLEKIEEILVAECPDRVVVYGDTNSTLAGALAAAKVHIPVAHVEAGLRSFNRGMPEEINRIVVDHLSDLLLAPTQSAVNNLEREGISADWIRLVGDVMYDVALHYGKKAEVSSDVLARLSLHDRKYVLATIHRAENTDNPAQLSAIFGALVELAKDVTVVVPLHPRTRQALDGLLPAIHLSSGLRVIEPIGYLDMTMLEKHARVIVTDSGGVQKEAFFHGVPCVTLRYETEWVELVQSGWNQLVPPRSEKEVYMGILGVLERSVPSGKGQFYGDGCAAEAVVHALLEEHVARPVS